MNAETTPASEPKAPAVNPIWNASPPPFGRGDWLAIGVWTLAIVAFFWDAITLQKALFYFDITELNYTYRDFLAKEWQAGRLSRWMPGLYCGLPLYSESQAGYWHPLKPLLYTWLATWKAFNLDTILSVWLTGLATYGWLRRHVGPIGALTGGAVFGLSGFVWAHLIHTSMNNALTSVPLVFWAVEVAWDGGKLRGVALGALALACQVFAGHLQDTILTSGALGLYALFRAVTERGTRERIVALAFPLGIMALGVAISAIQWVPSKELLDRSPRAGGLTWEQVTYGSWSPELLPTLVVREAYGTRARDTDWMDGYYPYHEMNAYLGLIAIGLAVIGASASRDRWVAFLTVLALVGSLLMLGRYTAVFDVMHRIPVVGSSRIPVRYHLWVSLAVAGLAAVGVDRLARPGVVRLRGSFLLAIVVLAACVPLLIHVYSPVWNDPNRWNTPYHVARYRWLGWELSLAGARTLLLLLIGASVIRAAARSRDPKARSRIASMIPLLVIADLLGSHWYDSPSIDPGYWTKPPASAEYLASRPDVIRITGEADKSSGEPGYASEPVDFMAIRDTLAWSLAPVWGISNSSGITPIFPRRMLNYTDHAKPNAGYYEIEGVTHLLARRPLAGLDPNPVLKGTAYIHRNPRALPRARFLGRPIYTKDEAETGRVLETVGPAIRERIIVEDPARPLKETDAAEGSARIVSEIPERVEVEVDARTRGYFFLADTFDPGWTVTVDGKPGTILPAYSAFRAVFLEPGTHRLIFRYEPAGFRLGGAITGVGLLLSLVGLAWPRSLAALRPPHDVLSWPSRWPWLLIGSIGLIILLSAFQRGPDGIQVNDRWTNALHTFTWGSGIDAIKSTRSALGR